jgi:hypothetical protein
MINLTKIRPKTLPDNQYAYLEKHACVLDFGTSSVLMPTGVSVNYQPTKIAIKDLFNMELEKGLGLKNNDPRPSILIPDLDWKTIPMNLVDVGVFNSISSAGDAIFWHAKLILSRKSWKIKSAGFIYYLEFSMAKILDWIPEDKEIIINLDHNANYYINQMFKDMTKTKPKVMKIAFDKENVYFMEDSDECNYCLMVKRACSEFTEKDKSFDKISQIYLNQSNSSGYKQIDRKSFIKDRDSLCKHLLKACGDTPKYASLDIADKYESDTVKLWINKKKS